VIPSPAGDSYYKRCIDVLRAHANATNAAKSFATGLSGSIVIGLMPTMTRCLLAPVLMAFTEAHPNTVVRIVEGYSAPLTQQVRAGDLDFAIVPALSGLPGLMSRLFIRTPEVLVASVQLPTGRPDHGGMAPWRHLQPVPLAALGPLRLVLPSKVNTRRTLIETYCNSNGVEIARLLEMDAMLGTLDLVARSGWMTILPGIMMAVDDAAGQFKVAPLADPPMALDLVLIEPSRRPMSEPAQVFLRLLEAEAERLNARWLPSPPRASEKPVTPAKPIHRERARVGVNR
jgi:LysR family transcriptional regulator, nitrogen assimilation regulatory protein